MNLVAWLKNLVSPPAPPLPPPRPSAEESEIVTAAEESRRAAERVASAVRRYTASQEGRLARLEELVGLYEQARDDPGPNPGRGGDGA